MEAGCIIVIQPYPLLLASELEQCGISSSYANKRNGRNVTYYDDDYGVSEL